MLNSSKIATDFKYKPKETKELYGPLLVNERSSSQGSKRRYSELYFNEDRKSEHDHYYYMQYKRSMREEEEMRAHKSTFRA